jgi:hypothetical protein
LGERIGRHTVKARKRQGEKKKKKKESTKIGGEEE